MPDMKRAVVNPDVAGNPQRPSALATVAAIVQEGNCMGCGTCGAAMTTILVLYCITTPYLLVCMRKILHERVVRLFPLFDLFKVTVTGFCPDDSGFGIQGLAPPARRRLFGCDGNHLFLADGLIDWLVGIGQHLPIDFRHPSTHCTAIRVTIHVD